MPCRMTICAVLIVCSLAAVAQQPTPTLTPDQAREQYRASKAPTLRDDFGELARYRDANAALKPPAPSENRVARLITRSRYSGSAASPGSSRRAQCTSGMPASISQWVGSRWAARSARWVRDQR